MERLVCRQKEGLHSRGPWALNLRDGRQQGIPTVSRCTMRNLTPTHVASRYEILAPSATNMLDTLHGHGKRECT